MNRYDSASVVLTAATPTQQQSAKLDSGDTASNSCDARHRHGCSHASVKANNVAIPALKSYMHHICTPVYRTCISHV
jgi:hypothetical protein